MSRGHSLEIGAALDLDAPRAKWTLDPHRGADRRLLRVLAARLRRCVVGHAVRTGLVAPADSRAAAADDSVRTESGRGPSRVQWRATPSRRSSGSDGQDHGERPGRAGWATRFRTSFHKLSTAPRRAIRGLTDTGQHEKGQHDIGQYDTGQSGTGQHGRSQHDMSQHEQGPARHEQRKIPRRAGQGTLLGMTCPPILSTTGSSG